MFGRTRTAAAVQRDDFTLSTVPSVQLGEPRRLRLPFLRLFVRRGPPLIIPEAHKPLWHERGWRRQSSGTDYFGHYAAGGHTWRGLIQEPYPNGYQAYIWYPPLLEIQTKTTHGPCFSANGEAGRYRIHFRLAPTSLDHAITTIEAVLTQACIGKA